MILDEIAEKTRNRIALEKEKCSPEKIRSMAEMLPVSYDFPFERAQIGRAHV